MKIRSEVRPRTLLALCVLPFAFLLGCPSGNDEHKGHDHDSQGHESGEHEGHDHDDDDNHEAESGDGHGHDEEDSK